MDREIRYTTSADGTSIAWTRFGSGNVEVAWLGGFVGHLEVMFEQPQVERFFDRLGAFARVVAYDKRGQGLSDRPDRATTMEEHAEDLLAVMDAAGLDRPASATGSAARAWSSSCTRWPSSTSALRSRPSESPRWSSVTTPTR